ncbi:hypothetical protein SAMN05444407_101639 [Chryseobacterium contaminans]|uniref:Uncharacterized protein n=1 Tax=Chryseobacterium contaminans TaxID=1423959 RepID=A0A1M6WI34_9FLAO|nr:hypothetical protein SAMN05444407_101639 [Chryseobacterium contaminans]
MMQSYAQASFFSKNEIEYYAVLYEIFSDIIFLLDC